MDNVPTLAGILRELRRKAGLTQEELAERAGLSVRGVSDLERGARTHPYRHTMLALANGLGVEGSELELLAAAGSAPRALSFAALPSVTTSLVGRERELAAVRRALSEGVRLLSLVGPGGVGKTRLAIAAASAAQGQFDGAVLFVDLTSASEPKDALVAIAREAGIEQRDGRDAAEGLVQLIGSRAVLVVLDNFEQVVEAGPRVAALLAQCPRVQLLVTSRAPLRVSAERVFNVEPLAVPGTGEAADAGRYAAVELLRERAAASGCAVPDDGASLRLAARIVAEIEGLPLAIELAAARLPLLGLEGLAARLGHPLVVLRGGPRDAPARHRSLRATIQWSYDLLSKEEQAVLRLLSMFEGGWVLEEAEALAGCELLDEMGALQAASLIRRRGAETWLNMPVPVREFAADELVRHGEADEGRRRHLALFAAEARNCEEDFKYHYDAWRSRYEPGLDNFRSAMRSALETGDREAVRLMVARLFWLFETLGLQAELLQWATAAVGEEPGDPSVTLARALWAKGAGHWMLGQFGEAGACFRAADAMSRELGDGEGSARAAQYLGLIALTEGLPEEAELHLREALRIYEGDGGEWDVAFTMFLLGDAVAGVRPEDAAPLYRRSLTIFESMPSSMGIALAVTGLGGIAMRRNDFERARELFLRGLELRRAAGHTWTEAISLASLAELSARAGDEADARSYGEDALALFQRLGDAQRAEWVSETLTSLPANRPG